MCKFFYYFKKYVSLRILFSFPIFCGIIGDFIFLGPLPIYWIFYNEHILPL